MRKVILLSKQNQGFQPADNPWRWKRMAKTQNWVSWPHYCLMWSLIVTVNWSDLESARRHTFKASRCVLGGVRSKKSHCEGRCCHLMGQNPGVNKRKNKKGGGRMSWTTTFISSCFLTRGQWISGLRLLQPCLPHREGLRVKHTPVLKLYINYFSVVLIIHHDQGN